MTSFTSQGRFAPFHKGALAGEGLDHVLILQLEIGFQYGVPIDPKLLGERPNRWQGSPGTSTPEATADFT